MVDLEWCIGHEHYRARWVSLILKPAEQSGFKGYDMVVDYCDAKASGASDIKITVNQELSAEASGASDVNYKGSGLIRDVNTSGSSSISRRS